ncbi:MAG: DNA polymerase III subunit delta' [Pyrinomonadaceae bacterium]
MFDKFIGNNRIKENIKRMIESKRVPHSLLFVGAEGIGKKQFALELAKTFVCHNPKMGEACDVCSACKRASKFAFPKFDDRDGFKRVIFSEHSDVGLVVPFNKNILVDAIRELETEANFRPFEAEARFFLIDEADKMNESASNALLKTLEEPAPTTYLFLITSRPDALLPTIRSRCQIVRFAPIEVKQIENYLLAAKKFSPADAELLSKLSAGSVGHALNTDLEKFRGQREAMLQVLESLLVTEDRAALLRVAEEMNDAKNKDEYETRLEILQTLIHDIWALRLGGSTENLVNVDIVADLKKLSDRADSKILPAWLSEIETLRERLAVNINRKIATDALFMQMAAAF